MLFKFFPKHELNTLHKKNRKKNALVRVFRRTIFPCLRSAKNNNLREMKQCNVHC